ncbi:MAG: hypothetical protein P8R42_24075 [Candidatus Binatia bacterium]|nr:hypothetical protein [Candidatus Binatia bacterium]
MANCSSSVSPSRSPRSKYLPRNRKLPSQGWRAFLRNNHLRETITIGLAMVPTVTLG